MGKEKKQYVSFYLEKSLIKKIEEVVNDPNNIFDDKSTLLRYCVKQQLPLIIKELSSNKGE